MTIFRTCILRSSRLVRQNHTLVSREHSGIPVGVAAALDVARENATKSRKSTLLDGFSLAGRVGIVSGANRGLGLEMALTLAEAGAKVYALDLPAAPGDSFRAVQKYVDGFQSGAKLSYVSGGVDVTDQKRVWEVIAEIGSKEGRVDVGIAAAGIILTNSAMEFPAKQFEKVINVDTNGAFYTAQAVAQQMERLKTPGSIILVSSMAGSVGNRDQGWVAYHTSKGATTLLARSLACEWGPQGIRVNSLSPGYIYTEMTGAVLDVTPGLQEKWSNQNPLGRIGRPDELRGVIAWLASDMSTFCTGSDILVTGGHHAW